MMRPHRRHMSPFHMEILLFLRCNKILWDVTTVEDCLAEPIGATAADEATVYIILFKYIFEGHWGGGSFDNL